MTPEQAEKFADWIIAQENKMIAARYPITPEIEAMSDDELLAELEAPCWLELEYEQNKP